MANLLANNFKFRRSYAKTPQVPVEMLPYRHMILAGLAAFLFPFALAVAWEFRVRRIGGSEELDMLRRVWRASGTVVWVPAMRVEHFVPASRLTLPYLFRFRLSCSEHRVLADGPPVGPLIAGVPRWLLRRIVETDGTKFILTDGSWLGVRLSGTEPVVRVTGEGEDKVLVEEVVDGIVEALTAVAA